MASVDYGELTPVEGSVGDLFGDKDVDGGSEVLSASFALTDLLVDGKKSTTECTDVAKVDFQHVVGAAWDSSSSEHVEPIWNTGFLKCFFRDDSLGDTVAPQFKRPMPTSDFSGGEPGDTDERQKIDVPQVLSGPYFQTRVKGTENFSWQEKCMALLPKSLRHWLVLTTTWRCDIEIVICLQGGDSSNSQLIMLGDVFRGKATSTLDKRSNSMKLMCNMLSKVVWISLAVRPCFVESFVNCVDKVYHLRGAKAF